MARRVTREQIAEGQPVVGKQAGSGGRALLDHGGIGASVGDQDPTQLSVVPTKSRHPCHRAVQNPELTGRRRARELWCPLSEHILTGRHPASEGS